MSNMNKIVYDGRNILDDDIAIGGLTNNVMLYQALISEELKPDSFIFHLYYDRNQFAFLADSNGKLLTDSNGKYLVARVDGFNPEEFHFGAPLKYYKDNGAKLVGQFYVKSVRRIGKKLYRFECISAIGLLTYRMHKGGLYNNDTVGNVIASIMGNIPYTIDDELATVSVTGFLPRVSDARENLRAVLFMSGGAAKRNSNGTLHFGFIGSETAKQIPDVNLGVGGQVSYLTPATLVEVTSHEYRALASDETVVLYDNTNGLAASYLTVDFQGPYHDIVATGLRIDESGTNYAVVTGVGTLTGKRYTHATSVYSLGTGLDTEPYVIQVADNLLINPRNVANVAKRIAGYYSIAKEVNYTMRVNEELPGDRVTFKDPWGDRKTGFIKAMNITLSKRLNSSTTIALDWTPGPFGDSYSACRTFKSSDINAGTLYLPSRMVGRQALIVLISGAGGGQGGYDGTDGEAPSGIDNFENDTPGLGGTGGEGGEPGTRSRIVSFYVDSLPASFGNASIGAGGAGGARNGGAGSPGGDTTLDVYSTATGTQLEDDYINFVTGAAYGTTNERGEAGASGGIGAGRGTAGLDSSTNGDDHVCRDGRVWSGGAYANGEAYHLHADTVRTGGAGGGGAAHGAAGSDGFSGYNPDEDPWNVDDYSQGGDGANAAAPTKATETKAGQGGHGGGGGGGAAQCYIKGDSQTGFSYGFNYAGSGGRGSAGGAGGDGLIVVYYDA